MKRSVTGLFLVVVASASSVLAAETDSRKSYLVATRRPVREVRLPFIQTEAHDVHAFTSVNGYAADLTDSEVAQLRKSPEVRFIEPDYERHAMQLGPIAPSVSRYTTGQTVPFGIDLINSRKVWKYGTGATIKVGVIDSGIEKTHPDLKDVYKGGYDFIQSDDDPQDENQHGTHVAGTIAASDNNLGVVGVAPNVEIYALRVLNAAGTGSTSAVIRAIDWAITNKMNIISLSLGSDNSSVLEESAFKRAADAGILAIAASGNGYNDNPTEVIGFPAAYGTVLSVGAVNSSSAIAGFSQRGPELKLVAPGVGVLSSVTFGKGMSNELSTSGQTFESQSLTYSGLGEVSGKLVFSGLGRVQDFSSQVRGKIALIQRGEITFAEKAKNAKTNGATAVIIFNNDGAYSGWQLSDEAFEFPVTLGVDKAAGEKLKALADADVTVAVRREDYSTLNGTSMATPHVSGVAALIWSLAPTATAAQVRDAMLNTAKDLGAPGWDTTFGFGLVDAQAAAMRLAPTKFPAKKPKKR